jgi:hypothetical protein
MKHLWIIPFLLAAAPASAEEPNEEAKKAAILRAYQPVRIAPVPLPVARPEDKNELDEQADLNMDDLRKFVRRANYKTDICARYHKRKVMVRGGKSWRCK